MTGGEAGPLDDAALLHPEGAGEALVFTLDVITPIVDDPAAFGRIAAANALSDVYAMGGEPKVALSFAGLPDALGLEAMRAVLSGLVEKAKEAGCAVVGGHTIKDSEPKCGLCVLGAVADGQAWTHQAAKPGQALLLTKPLGTGVVGQAIKQGEADAAWVFAATRSMELLNREARDVGRRHGATAATDVTGFGFLGHLWHLASASGVRAVVEVERVPLLPGALEASRAGFVPGGSRRNLRYADPHVEGLDALDEPTRLLLADAQTSGGLLLALPEEDAEAAAQALFGAAVVGRREAAAEAGITLV